MPLPRAKRKPPDDGGALPPSALDFPSPSDMSAQMPEPTVAGVRLLLVDTSKPLDSQERAIMALAREGYQPTGQPTAVGDKVLFMFTRVEWENGG